MFLNLKRKESILSFKVPLPYVVGAICISMIGMQLYTNRFSTNAEAKQSASQIDHCESWLITTRSKTIGLTRPLLLTDNSHESESLNPLKATIQSFIASKKAENNLIDCSVYYRQLNDGQYFSIDNGIYYRPGSAAKLTILIAILKQSEKNPNLLSKKLIANTSNYTNLVQEYKDEEIVNGHLYTIKELLAFMITKSSNLATGILMNEVDVSLYKELFRKLSLQDPNLQDTQYTFNVEGISKFLRLLYNATYLNETNSEYALQLLTNTNFNEGFKKVIPKDITVAHKFGEQGDKESRQLHETAIVYFNKSPYLLTVMTKGKNAADLPPVLQGISAIIQKTNNVPAN